MLWLDTLRGLFSKQHAEKWTVYMEDGNERTFDDAESAERFSFYRQMYGTPHLMRFIDVRSCSITLVKEQTHTL